MLKVVHCRNTALSSLTLACHLFLSICVGGEALFAQDLSAPLPVEISEPWGIWSDGNPWNVRGSSVGAECFDGFSLPDNDWIAEKIASQRLVAHATDRQVIDLALDEWIQPHSQSHSHCSYLKQFHQGKDWTFDVTHVDVTTPQYILVTFPNLSRADTPPLQFILMRPPNWSLSMSELRERKLQAVASFQSADIPYGQQLYDNYVAKAIRLDARKQQVEVHGTEPWNFMTWIVAGNSAVEWTHIPKRMQWDQEALNAFYGYAFAPFQLSKWQALPYKMQAFMVEHGPETGSVTVTDNESLVQTLNLMLALAETQEIDQPLVWKLPDESEVIVTLLQAGEELVAIYDELEERKRREQSTVAGLQDAAHDLVFTEKGRGGLARSAVFGGMLVLTSKAGMFTGVATSVGSIPIIGTAVVSAAGIWTIGLLVVGATYYFVVVEPSDSPYDMAYGTFTFGAHTATSIGTGFGMSRLLLRPPVIIPGRNGSFPANVEPMPRLPTSSNLWPPRQTSLPVLSDDFANATWIPRADGVPASGLTSRGPSSVASRGALASEEGGALALQVRPPRAPQSTQAKPATQAKGQKPPGDSKVKQVSGSEESAEELSMVASLYGPALKHPDVSVAEAVESEDFALPEYERRHRRQKELEERLRNLSQEEKERLFWQHFARRGVDRNHFFLNAVWYLLAIFSTKSNDPFAVSNQGDGGSASGPSAPSGEVKDEPISTSDSKNRRRRDYDFLYPAYPGWQPLTDFAQAQVAGGYSASLDNIDASRWVVPSDEIDRLHSILVESKNPDPQDLWVSTVEAAKHNLQFLELFVHYGITARILRSKPHARTTNFLLVYEDAATGAKYVRPVEAKTMEPFPKRRGNRRNKGSKWLSRVKEKLLQAARQIHTTSIDLDEGRISIGQEGVTRQDGAVVILFSIPVGRQYDPEDMRRKLKAELAKEVERYSSGEWSLMDSVADIVVFVQEVEMSPYRKEIQHIEAFYPLLVLRRSDTYGEPEPWYDNFEPWHEGSPFVDYLLGNREDYLPWMEGLDNFVYDPEAPKDEE